MDNTQRISAKNRKGIAAGARYAALPLPRWIQPFKDELRPLLAPERPARTWVILSAAILLLGTTALVVLLYMGYRDTRWPAEYLQDGQPGTVLTVSALTLAGTFCLLTARRCRLPYRGGFWVVFGLMFLWTAADDQLRIHESIGHAVSHLAERESLLYSLVENSIVATYGFIAMCYTWQRREQLLRLPWTVYSFAMAFVLFVLMVVMDILTLSQTLEESAKTLATLFILIGCLAAWFDVQTRQRQDAPA